MARQKQIPVLVRDSISTEKFTPVVTPSSYIKSVPLQDVYFDSLGYWITSAGVSAIPADVIPNPYLISGTVDNGPANYAWWIYKGRVLITDQYAIAVEYSYDFEIEEYNNESEIEEFWYFS